MLIEKLIWFNKIVNTGLGKDPLVAEDSDIIIEKDRSDFYSRFFTFIINKLTYTDGSHKLFNNRDYIQEMAKMLTNPTSFADRFVTLKTFINVTYH